MRRGVEVEDLVLAGGIGLAELLAGPGAGGTALVTKYSPDELTITWTLDALDPV